MSGLVQIARWGQRRGREREKGSDLSTSKLMLLPRQEVQNMNDQLLPLLFRVLFQGTHTLLKATRKNKELHHKIKYYNINGGTVCKITALTLQRCQCHERKRLTHCFRLKATKEMSEWILDWGKRWHKGTIWIWTASVLDFFIWIIFLWLWMYFLGNTYQKYTSKGAQCLQLTLKWLKKKKNIYMCVKKYIYVTW